MRAAQERAVWGQLRAKHSKIPAEAHQIERAVVDLAQPCVVLGGRNGVGKSRLLRALAEKLGDRALYIDLHYLVHRLLTMPTDRTDLEDLLAEYSPMGPDAERRSDLARIIGRDYDDIEWYALELETVETEEAKPPTYVSWLDETIAPYFRATYAGRTYSSSDMGLGELSTHLLLWLLEQYREKRQDEKDLVLLLDEPDAYLPPVGAAALVPRLLKLCLSRSWRIVMSTHSNDVISQAVGHDAFIRLDVGADGAIESFHIADHPDAADSLLAAPPVRYVAFVEDRSAYYLTRSLLRALDPQVERGTIVTRTNDGASDLLALQKHLPREPRPALQFLYLADGDQRERMNVATDGKLWPLLFLPTSSDPDSLLMSVGGDTAALAARLGVSEQVLRWQIADNEGKDPHDWVDDLADAHDYATAMTALADLWVESHPDEVAAFHRELRSALN